MPFDPAQYNSTVPAGLEFYHVPPARISGTEANIEGDEFAHLTHVMRHTEGDTIGIVNGAGTAYLATITSIRTHVALCALVATYPGLRESHRRLTLAVGMLKNPSRFETMVEKATELGVRRIIPLLSTRTIPRHAKGDRWQAIALAAMKQCGRCILPEIAPPTGFRDVLVTAGGLKILFHEQATMPMEQCLGETASADIVVCIGPEGGFTEAEVASAGEMGWQVVSLGDRRLRSETAAIAAAARLLT